MTDDPTLADALKRCADEPIHIPGSVQPHGVLFVLDGDGRIQRVSTSCEPLLAAPPSAWLERPLQDRLRTGGPALLASLEALDGHSPRVTRVSFEGVAGEWLAVAHRNVQGEIIVEVEAVETAGAPSDDNDDLLVQHAARSAHTQSLSELCDFMAQSIRSLTGFDRVMVYRFGPEKNGHVIAEARDPSLVSYLGWRYPASDIPEQARTLYETNWVRGINDVAYEPALLVPASAEPLDLSHSTLRSVSPIHRHYMMNMGYRATLSISLLDGMGRLWGLIACHHREALNVRYRRRALCACLGQIYSWQIQARLRSEVLSEKAALQRRLTALVDRMATGDDRIEALAAHIEQIGELVPSTGVAIMAGSRLMTFGEVPDSKALFELRNTARREATEGLFHRHDIEWPAAQRDALSKVAAGCAAIALDADRTWIFWLRPELVRDINWGGNPYIAKVLTGPKGAMRLSPRGSFELWQETVRHTSTRFSAPQLDVLRQLQHHVNALSARRASRLEQMTAELNAANQAKDEFLAMVSHELRTPLNAITGWVKLLRSRRLPPDKQAHAVEVIERNARAQAQIIEDLLDISRIVNGRLKLNLSHVDPLQSIQSALESLQPSADLAQVRLTTALEPEAGPILADEDRLQQIVNNLVSNAIKFTPKGGRVRLTLRRVASMIEIIVRDSGQGFAAEESPLLFDSFRQGAAGKRKRAGLGLGLSIVKRLVDLHGGAISADSPGPGEGATFVVRLPISPVADALDVPPDSSVSDQELAGCRVLIVEDDPDSRAMLQVLLETSGARVTTYEEAQAPLAWLARGGAVDCIVSDIGLPEMDGHAFIRALRTQGGPAARTPAVALTAYARGKDRTRAYRAGFQAHLAKPVDPEELIAVIARLCSADG